jgi:choline dehydrogenase-like flavoprotein
MSSQPPASGRSDGEMPPELATLVDAIVPADAYPSGSQAGVIRILAEAVAEHPPWRERVSGLVRGDDVHRDWFERLVQAAYYSTPAGSASAGWHPDPVGGWPDAVAEADLRPTPFPQLGDRYDAIVVGSGAGGGTAACVLAEAGLRVLVVERGELAPIGTLAHDLLRNPRVNAGLRDLVAAPATELREVLGRTVEPSEPLWSANAFTVGGGTAVYGAQAWRFDPRDLRMASEYGTPEGSALADWPIGYDDLEPWYQIAEEAVGVSGEPDRNGGTRSAPFPMGPVPRNLSADVLAVGAARLGIGTVAVPLAVNSTPYGGRAACVRCARCVGFACPVDAKGGARNTVLPRALAAGAALVTGARAVRIRTSAGAVTGVDLVDERTGARRAVTAEKVVVAAGAIETARLLLSSAHEGEPDGIGNAADQVGRHLQGHVYAGALGVFDEPVVDLLGPGPTIATTDFRHGNQGLVGGGMLANEFVPTAVSAVGYLRQAGLVPPAGLAAKQALRELYPRTLRVVGPIQEVTTAGSRVLIDRAHRDASGMPRVRLQGSLHAEDLRTAAFMSERADDWLTASGATRVIRGGRASRDSGPSAGQHQAGTARMGTDPATSVTDPLGRVWGHENLLVADGSLHVTNGGVNPVLTIVANAFRVASAFATDR